MGGAVQGVAMIAVAIVVGWLLQRTRAFPSQAAGALSSFVYWIAAPTLLFSVISEQNINAVLGAPLVAAAVSGVVSAGVFIAVAAPILKQRGGDLVLGAMSASVNNVAYMGIPIAVFVLGSAHHVVPVLVFQMGFFTPMFFVLAELQGKAKEEGISFGRVVKTVVTNPMVIGSAAGMIVSATGVGLPAFIPATTAFLGQAASPTILVAFGASLVGQSVRMPRQMITVVAWSSVCKMAIQPLAGGLAAWALGLQGMDLASVIIMAAMPTAQNAFIASMQAGAGREVAQGTILITTAVSLPLVVVLVAALRFAGVYTL